METDSHIIYHTTWSLNNESPFKFKDKLYKRDSVVNSKTKKKTRHDNESTSDQLHGIEWFRHQIKTICCIFCFLTCKTFKFHSVLVYLILLALTSLCTSMIQGGYINAVTANLQTQYNIPTSKVGLIYSSFDIIGVFATPIVSYIGSRYNKCRVIGICGFVYALGATVFTFPYFFSNKYSISGASSNSTHYNNVNICQPNATQSALNSSLDVYCIGDASNSWPYYLFILGQLCMSVGIAPLFSLGIVFLCDNLDESKHALYTGIIYGAYALGPAIGYLLASLLLAKWVNINETAPVSDIDPRWVGCWYIGFLISALLMVLLSIVLITFPDSISHSARQKLAMKKHARKCKNNKKNNPSAVDSQTSLNSISFTLSTSSNQELVHPKRVLHTIEESGENVDEAATNPQPTLRLDSVSMVIDSASMTNTSSENSTRELVESTSSLPEPVETKTPSKLETRMRELERLKMSGGHLDAKSRFKLSMWHLCIGLKHKLLPLFHSSAKLFTNLRYILLIFIMSIECIIISIFSHYVILYSQHVFKLSNSKSSIMVGGIIVPAAIIGAVLGGIIVNKFNLYIGGCTRLILASSIVVVSGIFILIFVRCDNSPSYGIDVPNQSFSRVFDSCNLDCNCLSSYNPTCGIDQVTYVSPCYAGCTSSDSSGYFNCNCVTNPNGETIMATMGACTTKGCDTKLIVFLIVLFVVVAAETLCITPATILILKLIDKPLQSFSLGILRCANLLIAYIPTPIVISQLIDHTCILWSNQCENERGSCLEYNSTNFHMVVFGAAGAVKIASCILLVIFAAYVHKNYILKRKYQNQVNLRHDKSSMLTSRQKYMIRNHVAGGLSIDHDQLMREQQSEEAKASHYKKKLERWRLRKREDSMASSDDETSVVLTKHSSFLNNSFVSLTSAHSQPEFFTDLNEIPSRTETPAAAQIVPSVELDQISDENEEKTRANVYQVSTTNV